MSRAPSALVVELGDDSIASLLSTVLVLRRSPLVLLALLALACSRSPPTPMAEVRPTTEEPKPELDDEPAPAPVPIEPAVESTGPSLAEGLRVWTGERAILLVAAEHGLLAFDGDETHELAPLVSDNDDSHYFRFDAALEIIWYIDGQALRAIDLRAPAGPPRELVVGLPNEKPEFALPDAGLWLGHDRVPEFFQLVWADPIALSVEGTWGEIINESVVDELAAMTIVDDARTWLGTLASRSARAPPKPAPTTKLEGVPLNECWDEQFCGQAVAWPGTSWFIYVDSFDCGDYCYWGCTLWDSKAKRTADPELLPTPSWDAKPEAKGGTCGTYFTAATSGAFTANGKYCTMQGCVELPGTALGFLDPGPTILAGPRG